MGFFDLMNRYDNAFLASISKFAYPVRGYVGGKMARSSGGERELALFETMAFFEVSQAVISERVWDFGNGEERILKGNKMLRG